MSWEEFETVRKKFRKECAASLFAAAVKFLLPVLITAAMLLTCDYNDGVSVFMAVAFIVIDIVILRAVVRAYSKETADARKEYVKAAEDYQKSLTAEEKTAAERLKKRREIRFAVCAGAVLAFFFTFLICLIAKNAEINSDYGAAYHAGRTYETERRENTGKKAGSNESASAGNKVRRGSNPEEPDPKEFEHPDDFYYFYIEEFADFEEAEDYYYSHGGK